MEDFVPKKEGIMNVEETKEFIEKALRKVNEEQINADVQIEESDKLYLWEFASKKECGIELETVRINAEEITNPTFEQKLSELTDMTDIGINLINYKISNSFKFTWKGQSYNMLINVGSSPYNPTIIKGKFGTLHMEETTHWTSSKKALKKFVDAIKYGFLIPSYSNKLEEESNKIWLIYDDRYKDKKELNKDYGKYIYVIGLSNGQPDNMTILVTCFNFIDSSEGYLKAEHVKGGISKSIIDNTWEKAEK